MGLSPRTRIGPYEIVSAIGAGGMGEVYKARDTKLERNVAIKILPELLADDPDRIVRFEREAKTLALLNHPLIAAIYGFEDATGIRALVMELVEGPTLADRLTHGAIPVADALPIARQIAEALDAAHAHGIIHRDLKPANIKVREDGTVKVLDFGLAKLATPDASGSGATAGASQSPTITSPAMRTAVGMMLGTAAYMSPEQAKGRAADRRSDIWAFGCVLYEILAGRRPFAGEGVSDTLAAVLKDEPDWIALPADTPLTIRRLLRRCLQKDRERRLADIADARMEIEDARSEPEPAPRSASPATLRTRERIAWSVAVLVLAASFTAVSVRYFREPIAVAPAMRFEINTPANTDPVSFAISPDGRQLVFVASGDGPSRLWLRPLAATAAEPLAGTQGASSPFWSPDSRSVGFVADGKLQRLDLAGGAPQALASAVSRGGTWNADGVILFARKIVGPLFRVSASGGDAVAITTLDRQLSHRWPSFLPDGRHFLFYAQGLPETSGIYLGSLDSEAATRLTAADTAGVYARSGWVLWVRAGTLVAQRLDLERRALAGEPVKVADPVSFDSNTLASALSASAAGPVAYRPGGANRRQLRWVDRAGKTLGVLGPPDEMSLSSPSISPDGHRVVVHRTVQGNTDVWLLDGTRTSRFTFEAAADQFPLWSPDGSQIVFSSTRKGARNLYVKPAAGGAGSEALLLESLQDKFANDWSADGRFLLYQNRDPQSDFDLCVLPLDGERKPWPFLKTNFIERWAQFSLDGRWVAYESNETGRFEIYVRPFTAPAAPQVPDHASANHADRQWQVSTAGGVFPRWRPDGHELYYIGPDSQMMAAPVTVTSTTLEPGPPLALFQTRIYGGGTDNSLGRQYDVAHDGRFLINTVLDDAASPMTVILNWKPGVQ